MKTNRYVLVFGGGVLCGFLLHFAISQRGLTIDKIADEQPSTAAHAIDPKDGWIPQVPTLMSASRSLDGVVYFLNEDRANKLVDTYAVFEGMLTDPDVKGPNICFWTDDATEKFGEVPYFPVSLGTDFPSAEIAERERMAEPSVLIVRYLARMRKTAKGQYYLENQTLLGYAYMSMTEALLRSPTTQVK